MAKIKINTCKKVIPMIYAYTTPEITRHNGWTKIGYTEQKVEERIKQQTHTADVSWELEWKGNAIFEDGTGELFRDTDFHAYLRKGGVEQEEGKDNEWFRITGKESREKFYDFKSDHGVLKLNNITMPYTLREEQEDAVNKTVAYRESHNKGEFLWNAKPRFGKTLSVYDLCKRIDAHTVLIVTNRPAIANSWYSDFVRFMGDESGYMFVSEVDALKGKSGVLTIKQYTDRLDSEDNKLIEFVSLQDLKGAKAFGGEYEKLREVAFTNWDILVIDEAHEGVDTYKTDVAFDRIKREFTLHLSGTPFKALAKGKFNEGAIYNWTYADEQKKKRDCNNNGEVENPYADLPQLNMFTYRMSDIVRDELKQGIEINGETQEYAFDLNEFFSVKDGKFVYDSSVDKFLDALTLQSKFPFSTPELRAELKHTFWLLNRVDSVKALTNKLNNHPVFKDYKVVQAVGDGREDEDEENKKSYDKVVDAIANNDKTITLSVGQLTTGITIPQWTAVLMLSSMKSPALYMQAAFRAQNAWLYNDNGISLRKENAYVFDFDPARTLTIFEEFANDLSSNTSSGRGSKDVREENVKELLNFFPVIGEDKDGEMIELSSEQVLTIPRKIKSVEVVKRGFMSNFLFDNVSMIFGAPREVIEIIESFEPVSQPSNTVTLTQEVSDSLSLDEKGEVALSNEYVIGKSADIFGDKIFDVTESIDSTVATVQDTPSGAKRAMDKFKTAVKEDVVKEIVDTVQHQYGNDMMRSDKRRLENKLNDETEKIVNKSFANYNIKRGAIEQQRTEALQARYESGKSTEEINREFDAKQQEAANGLRQELTSALDDFINESKEDAVRTVETNIREREKNVIEEGVRDHLRGFSRTIPSFLMAYGNDEVTLATFDKNIPNKVFEEVTSISLEQFRLLRDGGKYIDEQTGEEKTFEGHLFDEVVFNDSVKEFLSLKQRLADYFDEDSAEDIFDYIPPQKTNQIFTPKTVVKKMVDMLEQENPGCFDNPDKTFIDLYMKSGLYITEIVKRLYQSPKLRELYPNKMDRLKHIFEKQVYGLAPTEIIYKIATNYILGFDKDLAVDKHNFRQADALPYAKEGTLQTLLDDLFPE